MANSSSSCSSTARRLDSRERHSRWRPLSKSLWIAPKQLTSHREIFEIANEPYTLNKRPKYRHTTAGQLAIHLPLAATNERCCLLRRRYLNRKIALTWRLLSIWAPIHSCGCTIPVDSGFRFVTTHGQFRSCLFPLTISTGSLPARYLSLGDFPCKTFLPDLGANRPWAGRAAQVQTTDW